MLGVDQATVSRWERGAQMPDSEMQGRLRDILFRGRAISDARLSHFVRSAHGLMALIDADAKFVTVSESARGFIADSHRSLDEIMTPSLSEVWNAALNAGFFRGEAASITGAVDVVRPDGVRIYIAGSCHPAPLTDGSVLMLAEGREVPLDEYEAIRARGLHVTPIEEIL